MKLSYLRGILLVLFFISGSHFAYSQSTNSDEITMRNGSVLKGKITENSSEKVVLITSDGREYSINKSEIEKTTQNGTTIVNTTNQEGPLQSSTLAGAGPKHKYVPKPKGFWFSAELQLLAPLSLNAVLGYKLHQFAYLGLGIGIHNYTVLTFAVDSRPFTGTIIPIYVRYSGDILKKRVTPVYSLELGYGIAVSNGPLFMKHDLYANKSYNSTNVKSTGGVYGGIGFGFKVRTNKNVSFGAGFTYRIQQSATSETIDLGPNYGPTTYTNKYINNRFGLKLIFIGFN